MFRAHELLTCSSVREWYAVAKECSVQLRGESATIYSTNELSVKSWEETVGIFPTSGARALTRAPGVNLRDRVRRAGWNTAADLEDDSIVFYDEIAKVHVLPERESLTI